MAIIIPHRFICRLLPDNGMTFINAIVIGTFNPGIPDLTKLTDKEAEVFEKISASIKFQKFNQVKNFYDRPQNRFWKILDIAANPEFYFANPLKTRNPNGLKYYSGMDRSTIFENQNSFCKKYGILITDIVRQIEPDVFDNIYHNFPDRAIENSVCTWNTRGILDTVEKYKPNKILINFSAGKTMPKISHEILKIKNACESIVFTVPSTSGAAGHNYEMLSKHWHPHILPEADC